MELERAGRGSRRGGVEHEAPAHDADDRLAVAPPLAEVGIDDAGDGDLLGAQRVERLAPAVVRASCPCCRCVRAWRGDRGSPPARPAPGRCRRWRRPRRRARPRGRAPRPACRTVGPAWRRGRRSGARATWGGPGRTGGSALTRCSTRSQLAWKSSITRRRPREPPNVPHWTSWTSSAAVSPGTTSWSASSRTSSRRSSQRSSRASWLSRSSSTVNPGGRPASTGSSNRRRRANAWSVPIGAWSRASRATRRSGVERAPSSVRSR